ncbi:MAG: hypothetical protein D6690_14690 [Nitrospirae bacterium]|nr:MAG: hypothetical protein D6690_14690 [Nitrospirota bacterium]
MTHHLKTAIFPIQGVQSEYELQTIDLIFAMIVVGLVVFAGYIAIRLWRDYALSQAIHRNLSYIDEILERLRRINDEVARKKRKAENEKKGSAVNNPTRLHG